MIDFLNSDREKRTKKGTPTQWFSFTSSKIGFVSRSVRKRFRYPILSENSIYRYWIPYAGEEAAE